MTTTERIVESYYRLCKKCFTMTDVKVANGNNRQLDLLAFCMRTGKQYHIEISVTHRERWCPTSDRLLQHFEYKFFGCAREKLGENTDFAKGKTYADKILKAYESVGFKPDQVHRVWVCWTVKDLTQLEPALAKFRSEKKLKREMLTVVSFRDDILPELLEEVGTSHYDDDMLRILSLIQQFRKQRRDTP